MSIITLITENISLVSLAIAVIGGCVKFSLSMSESNKKSLLEKLNATKDLNKNSEDPMLQAFIRAYYAQYITNESNFSYKKLNIFKNFENPAYALWLYSKSKSVIKISADGKNMLWNSSYARLAANIVFSFLSIAISLLILFISCTHLFITTSANSFISEIIAAGTKISNNDFGYISSTIAFLLYLLIPMLIMRPYFLGKKLLKLLS